MKVFLLFLLDDEKGFGSVTKGGSGCGSGRPKSIRILRIRIHNTDSYNRQINARKSAMLNEIYVGIDEVDAI